MKVIRFILKVLFCIYALLAGILVVLGDDTCYIVMLIPVAVTFCYRAYQEMKNDNLNDLV